jgi:transcriptional regulator with XRE-family HTH domain
MSMSAGSLIRDTRRAEGLTQAQLARRLGITQPSVARLESAGDAVTVATLQKALNAMGRGLVLHAPLQEPSYDESLLRANLELTPAERLDRMTAGYARFRELAAAAEKARAA